MRVMERQRNLGLGASGHERGGGASVPAKADNALKVMERHAKFDLALVPDGDSGPIFVEISAFEGDEKCVEMSFHGRGFGIGD